MAKPTFAGALRWAFVMNAGQQGTQALITLVLAAVLGPAAFGLVAMALVYLEFFQLFVGQGLIAALIQRTDLAPIDLDTAFWQVTASTLALAGAAAATAPLWAQFNSAPELASIVLALTPMLLFKGLSVVQQADLQRRMDFRSLAIRSNAAAMTGGLVGLALAFGGAGAWSLVAQQVVSSFVEFVLLWKFSDFRPRARFSVQVSRELRGYGRRVLLNQVGVFASRRSDAIVLGYFFGPVALALYRMAERLSQLVIEFSTRPVAQASLPNLARLQADLPRLRSGVIAAVKTSSILAIPALVGLAAVSDPLIRLLGEKWHAAAPVLQILCARGIARALTLNTGTLLQAAGRPGLMASMTWALAAANAVGFTLVGFWLREHSVSDQVTGIASVRTGIFVLLYSPPYIAMLVGFSGIRWRDLLRIVAPSLLAGVAVLAAVATVRVLAAMTGLPLVASLAGQAFAGAAAGGATLYAVDTEFREHANALRRWAQTARSGARRRSVSERRGS